MPRVWFAEKAEQHFAELKKWKEQIVRLQKDTLGADDTNRNTRSHALVVATLSGVLVKGLGYVKVEFDNKTGKFHLDIRDMVITPLPNIPQDCIALVTLMGEIRTSSAYRRQGVYRHKGAEAIVETKQRVRGGDGLDGPSVVEEWQEIRVSGPSIETVKNIDRRIRNREEEPEEPWDDGKPNKERVYVLSLPTSAAQ